MIALGTRWGSLTQNPDVKVRVAEDLTDKHQAQRGFVGVVVCSDAGLTSISSDSLPTYTIV